MSEYERFIELVLNKHVGTALCMVQTKVHFGYIIKNNDCECCGLGQCLSVSRVRGTRA